MCVLLAQLCPTLCDPMDWRLPGSWVYGILQASILEWVAIPLGDLPDLGIEPGSPALQVDSLPSEPPGKPSEAAYPIYYFISRPASRLERRAESLASPRDEA